MEGRSSHRHNNYFPVNYPRTTAIQRRSFTIEYSVASAHSADCDGIYLISMKLSYFCFDTSSSGSQTYSETHDYIVQLHMRTRYYYIIIHYNHNMVTTTTWISTSPYYNNYYTHIYSSKYNVYTSHHAYMTVLQVHHNYHALQTIWQVHHN